PTAVVELVFQAYQKSNVNFSGVKGHVKWYNVWYHYGFIGRDDDPSADVFVHQSGIAKSRTSNPRYRTLDMDERVVFDVVAGKGGGMKKAVNVTGPDGEKNVEENEENKIRKENRPGNGGIRERKRSFFFIFTIARVLFVPIN
ncbi:unnamed protein product, partial [Enterobius vermicularis]|uniref:CSP domain-containing protein n=1 Tax=Enterobius vermicularis TaxID=51028 RepID=A0A0N4V707_ENTVE